MVSSDFSPHSDLFTENRTRAHIISEELAAQDYDGEIMLVVVLDQLFNLNQYDVVDLAVRIVKFPLERDFFAKDIKDLMADS